MTKFWMAIWGCFCAVLWIGARPPNIIIVVADDLGWGDLGCNGQERIHTPHLDRLAEEGLVFSQHYAASPSDAPSLGCLLTGRDTGTATIRSDPSWSASGQPVDLTRDDVTIAEELKRAGYRTALFGQWGLAEGRTRDALPWMQGFDLFFGHLRKAESGRRYPPYLWRNQTQIPLAENDVEKALGRYAPDLIADEVVRYLDTVDPEVPFFLLWTHPLPSYELTVPEESKDPYRAQGWPLRRMERGAYRHDPCGNLSYAGMVSRLDRDVGRMIAQLQRQGLAESTLVLFTSDNGPEFDPPTDWFDSNGPFRGGKGELFEGGLRVPLLAWWPGLIEPGTTDYVSASWDLLPTFCAIAGLRPTEDDLRGSSLVPALQGRAETMPESRALYWECNEAKGPLQALRRGDWKLIIRDGHPPELYNLAKDPGETTDLAKSERVELQRLLGMLTGARRSSPEFPLLRHPRAQAGK